MVDKFNYLVVKEQKDFKKGNWIKFIIDVSIIKLLILE